VTPLAKLLSNSPPGVPTDFALWIADVVFAAKREAREVMAAEFKQHLANFAAGLREKAKEVAEEIIDNDPADAWKRGQSDE